MAKTVAIDELHLTIFIPHELPDTQREEIRSALAGDVFMDRLLLAVHTAVRAFPELAAVRLSLAR